MARLLVAALCILLGLPAAAAAAEPTKAGVAVRDATWHVGASAGQFTDDTGPVGADGVDPHGHSVKKRISDGVGVRTSTRALVFEDGGGDRVAIVAHDLYLAQDLLTRRVASLLAEHDREVALGLRPGPAAGIAADALAVTASHNHMTPFYSTPGWGTAIFQDVIDVRFYDYVARAMADAVVAASRSMVPVRMGGITTTFDEIQSHTYGPKVGDDGTPAGQPWEHTTRQLSVVRLDDMSDPQRPKPMANWVVLGLHPEFTTWGPDLISGDFTQVAARMVDRELGTTSVFSQRETGASGPHKDERVHRAEARREFNDGGFAELDRASRLLADAILDAHRRIGEGRPERESAWQPFVQGFDVDSVAQRFAPPLTRPYPGVSNCNSYALFHGDPRLPVLGLPDCQSTPFRDQTRPLAATTGPLYDQLKAMGVPIPESYSATALTAVEETNAVHLMAIKLGDIGVTVSPTEQFTDTALNIESRLDRVKDNLWTGFDWTRRTTPSGRAWCVEAADGRMSCADPRNPRVDLPPISRTAYERFRAQIRNDAKGWETDLATLGSEAEPADPAKIKGNFTHEEHADHGFRLVLSLGMGNDYWGYTPEYREYRSHDHYRKALSGLGPHGADFIATRVSRMAASLNGGAKVPVGPQDVAIEGEGARAEALSQALGVAGAGATAAFERQLPADGGRPGITEQPKPITRFAAAHVTWVGGSNWTDTPKVRVERLDGTTWRPYADDTGEVPFFVRFPKPEELPAYRQGTFQWRWTASFEAFSSDVEQPDASGVPRRSTPAGTYRFVVEGRHRAATGAAPGTYRLESTPFAVGVWEGITAEDLRVDDDGRVSLRPGPSRTVRFGDRDYVVGPIDYPDSYAGPFRYLRNERRLFTYGSADPSRHQQYCQRCTFRPWIDAGDLAEAFVTVRTPSGEEREVPMTRGADGRWRTTSALGKGETALVAPGGLRDPFGNRNGAASAEVRR
jgi:hypothetical protein